MKRKLPLPGWRNIKSTAAVMICFLVFAPWWGYTPVETGGPLDQIGPFYACVAAVICMQSSVESTIKSGLSRLFGTLVGGLIGLAGVSITISSDNLLFLTLMIGVGTMLSIYLCVLARQSQACSIAVVVYCAIMLSHSGDERYFYAIARMGETAVGILVAVVINQVLPDRRDRT